MNQGPRKPATRWSKGASHSWGPYWDVLFPPAMVTGWINWKRGSAGVNVAWRLWVQREKLRGDYEAEFGADPDGWPTRHPVVFLYAAPTEKHQACLGCHWFLPDAGPVVAAAARHGESDGRVTFENPWESGLADPID